MGDAQKFRVIGFHLPMFGVGGQGVFGAAHDAKIGEGGEIELKGIWAVFVALGFDAYSETPVCEVKINLRPSR